MSLSLFESTFAKNTDLVRPFSGKTPFPSFLSVFYPVANYLALTDNAVGKQTIYSLCLFFSRELCRKKKRKKL